MWPCDCGQLAVIAVSSWLSINLDYHEVNGIIIVILGNIGRVILPACKYKRDILIGARGTVNTA